MPRAGYNAPMANPDHLRLVFTPDWQAWRQENPRLVPDFVEADLRGADLSGKDLSRAILSRADLQGANLTGANLTHAQLDGIDLDGACLDEADLSNVRFDLLDIRSCSFERANLMGATFRGANLIRARMRGARLAGVNFEGGMFDLADLMAHVEVGVATARRAAALAAAGDPQGERAALVARIFAWEVCQLFERGSLRILTGTGEIDAAAVADSLAKMRFNEFAGTGYLSSSYAGFSLGSDPADGNFQVIRAQVPAKELHHYSTTVRSLTGGRGVHTEDFSHYEDMPRDMEQKVVEEYRKKREAGNSHAQ